MRLSRITYLSLCPRGPLLYMDPFFVRALRLARLIIFSASILNHDPASDSDRGY